MSAKRRGKNLATIVAALYAVAMLVLGFSHVGFSDRASARQAESIVASLPDGTPVTLCLSAASPQEQGKPGRSGHAAHFCAACCLTAAPGVLPSPPQIALDRLDSAPLAIAKNLSSAARSAALAPQSRGPPSA